ncbi:hypothetical protein Hanom_Chr05g00449141 [Helianthus anomalus]
MISFFSFRDRDEHGGNRYRKYRLRYRHMKVKIGSEPVLGTPKVGTELVLRILWFRKFGTDAQYYLLISDHEFHTNNIINIQLFCFIFSSIIFYCFLHFLFVLVSGSAYNTLVVISKHILTQTK